MDLSLSCIDTAVLLIHLKSNEEENIIYNLYYQQMIEFIKEAKLCVHYQDLESNQLMNDTANYSTSWFEKHQPTIILFGLRALQLEFLSTNLDFLKRVNVPIISHDLSDINQLNSHSSPLPNEYSTLKLIEFQDLSRIEGKIEDVWWAPLAEYPENVPGYFKLGFLKRLFAPYTMYLLLLNNFLLVDEADYQYFLQTRQDTADGLRCKGMWLAKECYGIVTIKWNNKAGRTHLWPWLNYKSFEKTHPFYPSIESLILSKYPFNRPSLCSNFVCGPGFFKTYTNITAGYTWKCEPCPVNHYKKTWGEASKCIPCNGVKSIDNGNRTACIDPYQEVSFEMTAERYFVCAICGFGIFITTLTMIVFTVKKKSPVVTLSDYTLSICHMVIICVIFGALFAANLMDMMNYEFCLIKLVFISISYTTNVGIVFTKSLKILQAFLSNVRLTVKEVKRTGGVQAFIVLAFSLLMASVLTTAIFYQPISILVIRKPTTITKQSICNTYPHTGITIGFNMILQLLCSIQAFRGRNLPTLMNDGIILTYTTFTLSVVFGVSFPIVFFQKDTEKEIFQMGAISLNNLIISFLMYGQKAIRMILYPEENTRAFYRESQMREMEEKMQQDRNNASNHGNNKQPVRSTAL